jgi:hypothetical protein
LSRFASFGRLRGFSMAGENPKVTKGFTPTYQACYNSLARLRSRRMKLLLLIVFICELHFANASAQERGSTGVDGQGKTQEAARADADRRIASGHYTSVALTSVKFERDSYQWTCRIGFNYTRGGGTVDSLGRVSTQSAIREKGQTGVDGQGKTQAEARANADIKIANGHYANVQIANVKFERDSYQWTCRISFSYTR